MPRDSAGNYTLPAGNPVITGTIIASTWANTTFADLSAEMTDSLDRSGKGGMLAALHIFDGVVGAPGISFASETGTGLYRIGAAQLGIAVNGNQIANIAPNGIVWDVAFQGASGVPAATFQGANSAGNSLGPLIRAGLNASDYAIAIENEPGTIVFAEIFGDGHGYLGPNNATTGLSWSATGQYSIAAPTSAVTALVIDGAANAYALKLIGSTVLGQSFGLEVFSGTNAGDTGMAVLNQSGSAGYFVVYGDGEIVIAQPSSAANSGASSGSSTVWQAGYLDAPQRVLSASQSLVFTDRGKQILVGNNNLVITIPSNASVAFPIGTTILIVVGNYTGNTLAISGDTLYFAGSGSTGTRNLAPYAMVTLTKIAATQWYVGGSGLS